MTIVLRGMTHDAAEAILAGQRTVAQKAGFAVAGETDDVDETGTVVRVTEWELRPDRSRGPVEHDRRSGSARRGYRLVVDGGVGVVGTQ